MDYFSILNLDKEPFSNSPDPDYFYKSRQHFGCLQKVELALRLKRGLNIVIGEVGTGKTTLCRQLLRSFAEDDLIETYLILDPSYGDSTEFLLAVARTIGVEEGYNIEDEWQIKEHIKKTLYRKGVEEDRIVILIIDEGQKLPTFCIELLREFLNYETNEFKLFQIAIFAQTEFDQVLDNHANFADRANLIHYLEPMNFRDTKDMIRYRLKQSSKIATPAKLFTFFAIWAIYRVTRGHPRKIINLCHQSILAMIIQNRGRVAWQTVRSCIKRTNSNRKRFPWVLTTATLIVFLGLIAVATFLPAPYSPKKYIQQGIHQAIIKYTLSADTGAVVTPKNSDNRQSEPETAPQNLGETVEKPEEFTIPVEKQLAKKPVDSGSGQSATLAVQEPEILTEAPTAEDSGDSTVQDSSTTTAKSQTVQPKPSPETVIAPPMFLGRLTVRSGDTLVKLITRVRGVYTIDYLESLLEINPHIIEPNKINVGDEIVFPALAVNVSRLIRESWRLEMDTVSSLDRAIEIATSLPEQMPPARVLPFWDSVHGLRFSILLQELFPNEISARTRLTHLPQELTKGVSITCNWTEETVFFANPF
jgi:general secretion pathway protein A